MATESSGGASETNVRTLDCVSQSSLRGSYLLLWGSSGHRGRGDGGAGVASW